MHIQTATDILDIRTQPLGEWGHTLLCPWCGEDAWASAEHFQCRNRSCSGQVASAEDLLAKVLGGYEKGEHAAARNFRRAVSTHTILKRVQDRSVLDLWLKFCTGRPSTASAQATLKLAAAGVGVNYSQFNCIVLDEPKIKELMELAHTTGAEFPDAWRTSPPAQCLAYCVQSLPYIVDRIVLIRGRSTSEVVWYRRTSGFSCLIGLSPSKPRLLVADFSAAMKLQSDLGHQGSYEEVCGLHRDTWRGGSCPPWRMDHDLLVAAPRSPNPDADASLYSPTDLINIQEVLNDFPGVEKNIKALPMSVILTGRARTARPLPWGKLRCGYIDSMTDMDATQMSPGAATLFERTGTKSEDSMALIKAYKRTGRLALADDVERVSENRVFFRNAKITVRETANEYQLLHTQGISTLANFNLRLRRSVMFDDASDSYCEGTLNCGNASIDVLFSYSLLKDSVLGLQEELQRQLSVRGHTQEANHLPTVIQVPNFRKYVMPHLRAQASKAKLTTGTDRLGWRSDRKVFVCPGFIVGLEGRSESSKFLCPSVQTLRMFDVVDAWSDSCPKDIDPTCQDIIAMQLATCVRYYKRCVTRPIMIKQSSDAIAVMEKLTEQMGQKSVYELNINARDGGKVDGIHGYPFLAAGPQMLARNETQAPYFQLCSKGYTPPTSPDNDEIDKAARALQFTLLRVVEWCIATGADEFKEMPALDYQRSLMREGQWLLENVCKLEPWEVSAPEPSALEKLLAQIPYNDTEARITLMDGENLEIAIDDLEHDHDGIMREARALGTRVAIEDGKLFSPAAKLLPAIANYYGQDPEIAVINSDL